MGLKLAGAAHRCDQARGLAKAVLNALAVLADDVEAWCWPSVDWIARAVGYSVRQVQRALAQLRALGLLEVTRPECGRGRLSRYRVIVDAWKKVTSAGPCARSACGQPASAACGQARDAQPEKVTFPAEKGDIHVTQQEDKQKEKVAPKRPVDKSGPWARGFSHLSGFFATSSCASFAPGAPCRPGGSPMPGLPPCTTPERSTATSAASWNATSSDRSEPGSVAELVAQFLAERRGKPGW